MRTVNEARTQVQKGLRDAAARLRTEGIPLPGLDGKVLRPLSAFLMVPEELRQSLDHRFWSGALAVEMVHEASLLHDDIIDEAPQRRGKPTMAAQLGVGPALVQGDHLLTGAYRAATATESPEFLDVFIRSVERTVAGEIAQERSQGRVLGESEYFQIITGKSGELFRSAFTLPSAVLGIGSMESVGNLGARFGRLYQMVDDFLDYCPGADRGKAPLQDYRQEKWTWPLGLIQTTDFEVPEARILEELFSRSWEGAPTPMEAGAETMAAEFGGLLEALAEEGLETIGLGELLADWEGLLRKTTAKEVESRWTAPETKKEPVPMEMGVPGPQEDRCAALHWDLKVAAAGLERPEDRLSYFGHHAKTFRFASRLFGEKELNTVAGVYAFCRFTDNLVDGPTAGDPELARARLHAWGQLARQGYDGEDSGIPLLNDVMGEMRDAGVPFHYAEELVQGMRMDLDDTRYQTLADLRVYSYRVASVVGGWLTELFGIQDPWVLDRAYALGHAMQLTNILRDVGEDLGFGRLYLPENLLRRYGVDRARLEAMMKNQGPVPPEYRELLEELMAKAEADYERAFEAIPALPSFFQGPVAVAASVYRGILREIRKNDYDNLERRASTSLLRKIGLGTGGLWALRRSAVRESRAEDLSRPPLPPFPRENGQEAAS